MTMIKIDDDMFRQCQTVSSDDSILSGRTRQESTGSYARARKREKWHRFRIMRQLKWGESREELRQTRKMNAFGSRS